MGSAGGNAPLRSLGHESNRPARAGTASAAGPAYSIGGGMRMMSATSGWGSGGRGPCFGFQD
jgi:hypothetical protein